ncbi:MAG: SpoIIE family protein phosphatase [Bacteroidia bacterium]|nr:SpoIIE family protein phosphatase [Bacteroidia bacterium]
MRLFGSYLLLLFFTSLCFAQTYSFTNYTVQDGLAQSNILGLVQDKNGYLWMGTESGVSRFDGKTFLNYTADEGLAENNISSMLMDRSGAIWYGHNTGSITRQAGRTFTKIENPSFPDEKSVYTFFQDKQGQLWISFIPYGVVVIKDPAGDLSSPSNVIVYQDKDLGEQVYAIAQDPKGIMWFHTRYGIKHLNPKNGKFEYYPSAELSGAQTTAFMIDRKGNFWMGQPYGTLKKFDPATGTMTHYTQEHGLPPMSVSEGMVGNFVNLLFEDSRGDIWIAAWDRGISRFRPAAPDGRPAFTNFSTANGLPINKIRSITEDREGNILMGTFGNGLSVFKGEKFISYTTVNGLVNNQVWGILKDNKGRYWFSTNEGLSIYDPGATEEKIFTNYKNIEGASSSSIRPIDIDKNGNIWMGTWGSRIIKYDMSRNAFTRNFPLNEVVFNHITCLKVDSKNRVWVGTPVGLTVLDQQSGEIRSYTKKDGLSEEDITCIYEDAKGILWIGTRQRGVNRFDEKSFYFYGKEEGLSNGSITSITEDKNGSIWLGTAGGGIFTYREGRFSGYRMKDGLISDYVSSVISDNNGNIWAGTNNGLCRFDPKASTFTTYGKMDGFTGVETKANARYKDQEGNLWFGTANGVFRFAPAFDTPNTVEPLLNLQSVKVNNKEQEITGMELSHKENSLLFEFTGISLSNPDGVRYKVKLEGFDDDWKTTSKNYIEYPNLDPGNYSLLLKAVNSSGMENAEALTLSFHITPPIWKRWWFYVLVTLAGLSILFAYIKIRERALIQEKRVLETKVAERTTEVMEKNKELAEKNKDIMDSIHYAKRIQDAILPPNELVRQYLPQTFILFKPKDIVSGDFYWLADKKDKVLFAAVDCTGHGVPGAFMSIVGHNMLEKIVNEYDITLPNEILEALNKNVSDTLRQSNTEEHEVKDGMDASVCMFDRKTNEFHFAGAMNPLYFIRGGVLKEIKGDKMPIGNLKVGESRKYTNHLIKLEKGDSLYIFTDGYADQFGGPSGKKFKYQQLKDTLLKIQDLSLEEQGSYLQRTIHEWMGHLDQVDDILVIGTRL